MLCVRSRTVARIHILNEIKCELTEDRSNSATTILGYIIHAYGYRFIFKSLKSNRIV